jgi:membrane-associated phospholipid phosphatase
MARQRCNGVAAIALVAGLLLAGCGQDRATDASPRAEPAAGTWQTWVLSSPGEIAVPAPPAAGSAAARADVAELQRLRATRTPAMARAARTEARRSPIQPWMDVNFKLVADRAKDPVAASRAYALLSVAMYDATVAAWKAKYRYRRSAPSGVGALADPGPDPSYPSEHAVIAGAASRVLAYLYPERPAAALDAMARRLARERVTAGLNYPSDTRAGLQLGRSVAAQVIAYAKSDGSDRRWNGARPHTKGSWEPPPGSLARPVSPVAGSWRTWVMTSGREFRPPPFPAYGTAAYRAQAQAVADAKLHLTPAQRKAALFWAGGQGTALPPGIWNQVVLGYLRREPQSIPRQARVLALLNVAQADAGVASWDAKFTYWVTRPENAIRDLGIDRRWKPLLKTPFFPAYISGHATYSGAAGEVMSYLFPKDAKIFEAKATEAADSRVWGGIHYPLDGTQGLRVGRRIGALVVNRARTDGAGA